MWHFGIWFSRHGGVGWMVGLDDLRDFFPTYDSKKYESIVIYSKLQNTKLNGML